MDRTSTEHLLHTMTLGSDIGAYDAYFAGYVMSGEFELGNKRTTRRLRQREALLTVPDIDHHTRWSKLDLAMVRLDRELMDQGLEELGGGVRPADLDLTVPRSDAHLRHWTATVSYVLRAVLDNPATASPIVRAETDRLLVTTTLSTFVGAALQSSGRREPAAAGTRTLRRALAFIESNADRPVTMADIAAAARVTPRALQLAFRRRLDTTPMAYLRQVRLSGAHRDLLAQADETTTIAAVAARWGFAHPGRFAALYRTVYGVTPTETVASVTPG